MPGRNKEFENIINKTIKSSVGEISSIACAR